MVTPVLWQDVEQRIILLDLPTSIQNAQASPWRIKSSLPPLQPYPATEPKGSRRYELLAAIPVNELRLSEELEARLHTALEHVKAQLQRTVPVWCLPRVIIDESVARITDIDISPLADGQRCSRVPVILSSTEKRDVFASIQDLANTVVCSTNDRNPSTVVIQDQTYLIPAASVFLLARLGEVVPILESSLQTIVSAVEGSTDPARFDLIVMDPPWSNRSVRHSRAYHTTETQWIDPFDQAMQVVGNLLADQGYVGIWTTNKARIRAQTIQTTHEHGLVLIEEWTWLKIAENGQPVTPIDGIWRKPYECMLLFQKLTTTLEIRKRTIIAVPDLHSRKPALRNVFEQFLPQKYRALEIFARNLTAGWWSVGDEVLKFQHESNWEMPSNTARFIGR